jgi:hypothetical protein
MATAWPAAAIASPIQHSKIFLSPIDILSVTNIIQASSVKTYSRSPEPLLGNIPRQNAGSYPGGEIKNQHKKVESPGSLIGKT